MLMHSDRITDEDLNFWLKYEEFDKIKTISLDKIQQTVDVIDKFVSENHCYCSISWGKDSVVLAHLCLQFQIPYIWIKEKDSFNPECLTVRDYFIEQYCVDYHEIECNSQYDIFKRAPFFEMCDNVQLKYGKRVTGIRNDESGRRLLRFKRWGFESLNTLCPLAKWKANEIFSYLYHNNLPVNSTYAMTMGGKLQRNFLRTDCIGGPEGDGIGRREWEKHYFPDILNRMN